jgi:hypothetical protein
MYRFFKHRTIMDLLYRQLKMFVVFFDAEIKNFSNYFLIKFSISLSNFFSFDYAIKIKNLFFRKQIHLIVKMCSLALILLQFW